MNTFRVLVAAQRIDELPIMTREELIITSDRGNKKDVEEYVKTLFYKVFSIKVRTLKSAALKQIKSN